jgi:general secretion pathway protein E
MRPLRLAGSLRVADGSTTLEELLAATPPAPKMKKAPPKAAH